MADRTSTLYGVWIEYSTGWLGHFSGYLDWRAGDMQLGMATGKGTKATSGFTPLVEPIRSGVETDRIWLC